jgi:hypothetical protein
MHELMCEKCRVWATVLALAATTPQVAEVTSERVTIAAQPISSLPVTSRPMVMI